MHQFAIDMGLGSGQGDGTSHEVCYLLKTSEEEKEIVEWVDRVAFSEKEGPPLILYLKTQSSSNPQDNSTNPSKVSWGQPSSTGVYLDH